MFPPRKTNRKRVLRFPDSKELEFMTNLCNLNLFQIVTVEIDTKSNEVPESTI